MQGSSGGVTHSWISLPSSGFVLLWDPNLPLGIGRPKSPIPSAHGVGSQDLELRRNATRRSGPLAYSVLRGRWFGARLRDLPPHSRFRAFDPLTQLSRRCQSLGWSVGLSRGAERFLFRDRQTPRTIVAAIFDAKRKRGAAAACDRRCDHCGQVVCRSREIASRLVDRSPTIEPERWGSRSSQQTRSIFFDAYAGRSLPADRARHLFA